MRSCFTPRPDTRSIQQRFVHGTGAPKSAHQPTEQSHVSFQQLLQCNFELFFKKSLYFIVMILVFLPSAEHFFPPSPFLSYLPHLIRVLPLYCGVRRFVGLDVELELWAPFLFQRGFATNRFTPVFWLFLFFILIKKTTNKQTNLTLFLCVFHRVVGKEETKVLVGKRVAEDARVGGSSSAQGNLGGCRLFFTGGGAQPRSVARPGFVGACGILSWNLCGALGTGLRPFAKPNAPLPFVSGHGGCRGHRRHQPAGFVGFGGAAEPRPPPGAAERRRRPPKEAPGRPRRRGPSEHPERRGRESRRSGQRAL